MRYTITRLKADLEKINQNHTNTQLVASTRNGYVAVDIMAGEKCIRTLECGTAKECLTAAYGYQE